MLQAMLPCETLLQKCLRASTRVSDWVLLLRVPGRGVMSLRRRLQGSGLLLSASQSLASAYMGRLATTLAVGANYREVLGGEAGAAPAVETFRADLDAEGVSVYLNLLD